METFSEEIAHPTSVSIQKLSPFIGAEINGIDLSLPLTPAVIAELKSLLVQHKVLFFRNQQLKSKGFIRFAQSLGTTLEHPFKLEPEKGRPESIKVFHTRENPSKINSWHSDATYLQSPPDATMLRVLKLPSLGGDTLFSNMETAYDRLDETTKAQIEDLVGIHDMWYFRESLRKKGVPEAKLKALSEKYPLAYHPVVKQHPVSGRKCIFVNKGFTIGIQGMEEAESQPLLQKLFWTAWEPEVQCRFRWSPGAVAVWDNRSSQHYPVADYWPETRGMERITIAMQDS